MEQKEWIRVVILVGYNVLKWKISLGIMEFSVSYLTLMKQCVS